MRDVRVKLIAAAANLILCSMAFSQLISASLPLSLLSASSTSSESKSYLALCAIVRDEPVDIIEWIEYHRRMGVGHFYITDHESSPPMNESLPLAAFIASGLVSYRYLAGYNHKPNPQLATYIQCLTKANRQRHKVGRSVWAVSLD